MESSKSVAKKYFKTHPSIDVFFVTSDGQAFFTEHEARNHGHSLKDTNVTKHERGSTEEENVSNDLKTKAVYVDKDDQEHIDGLKEKEEVVLVVEEKPDAVKRAEEELEELHNPSEAPDEVKTTGEQAQAIERARTTPGNATKNTTTSKKK